MGLTILSLLAVAFIFLKTCLFAGRVLFSGNFLGAFGIFFLGLVSVAFPIYYLFFYQP